MKELDLIRPARAKLAEDFTLATPGGGSFKLSEHRGKVVMINFWATWCPPCLEEMPAMERLYRQQKERGFALVAVSVDADPKKVTPFVAEHKLTFPVGARPEDGPGQRLRRPRAALELPGRARRQPHRAGASARAPGTTTPRTRWSRGWPAP